MIRAKKILVTAAMVVGVAAAAAAPAMADNHATDAPQHTHVAVVSPQDSHIS